MVNRAEEVFDISVENPFMAILNQGLHSADGIFG